MSPPRIGRGVLAKWTQPMSPWPHAPMLPPPGPLSHLGLPHEPFSLRLSSSLARPICCNLSSRVAHTAATTMGFYLIGRASVASPTNSTKSLLIMGSWMDDPTGGMNSIRSTCASLDRRLINHHQILTALRTSRRWAEAPIGPHRRHRYCYCHRPHPSRCRSPLSLLRHSLGPFDEPVGPLSKHPLAYALPPPTYADRRRHQPPLHGLKRHHHYLEPLHQCPSKLRPLIDRRFECSLSRFCRPLADHDRRHHHCLLFPPWMNTGKWVLEEDGRVRVGVGDLREL